MQFQFSDFQISANILENYKDILELILWSSTIETKDQKQYWIDSLSVMNSDQIENLRNILAEEKNELKKIDDEYNSKKNTQSQQKNTVSEEELSSKRKAILKAEKEDRDKEKKTEDDLLKQIEDI